MFTTPTCNKVKRPLLQSCTYMHIVTNSTLCGLKEHPPANYTSYCLVQKMIHNWQLASRQDPPVLDLWLFFFLIKAHMHTCPKNCLGCYIYNIIILSNSELRSLVSIAAVEIRSVAITGWVHGACLTMLLPFECRDIS